MEAVSCIKSFFSIDPWSLSFDDVRPPLSGRRRGFCLADGASSPSKRPVCFDWSWCNSGFWFKLGGSCSKSWPEWSGISWPFSGSESSSGRSRFVKSELWGVSCLRSGSCFSGGRFSFSNLDSSPGFRLPRSGSCFSLGTSRSSPLSSGTGWSGRRKGFCLSDGGSADSKWSDVSKNLLFWKASSICQNFCFDLF